MFKFLIRPIPSCFFTISCKRFRVVSAATQRRLLKLRKYNYVPVVLFSLAVPLIISKQEDEKMINLLPFKH
jgi:hypothetical protein